ncbi:MAG: tetratricopeptide repeat protein [Armatimonadetes bacterium]|nr:tetratricopeptide repeat protein [Armatimonadota bacterium]
MRKSFFTLIIVSLVAITLVVYWQTLGFDFTNFDDNFYVTQNRNVMSGLTWENVVWAFTARHANNWHPLTWISHMMDAHFGELDPSVHHMTNVLFHVANVVLLFSVFNIMTRRVWASAFVAALFAVHPLHVESVAWISERKDVLSTFFWFLTMLAYTQYAKKPLAITYALVIVLFTLGLLSKPMLVSLPLVLLMLDYWPLGRFQVANLSSGRRVFRGLVLEKTPLLVLSLGSCVVTFWVQKSTGAVAPLDACPLGVRLANAGWAYVQYLVKTVWPVGLACYYPHPGPTLPIYQVILSALFLIVITAITIRVAGSRPYLTVGWLWYLITLVPVIGIVQVGKQAMADRYTYIPLIGIFLIVAWGARDLAWRWRAKRGGLPAWLSTAGALVAIGIIAGLTAAAHKQVGYWRNDVSIWLRAIAVTKNNALAHYNLGTTLAELGNSEAAIRHFKKAVQADPQKIEAYCNLGAMLAVMGELREAAKYLRMAVKLCPKDAFSQYNLGMVLVKQGQYAEAIPHLRAALARNPSGFDYRRALESAVEKVKGTK